jgi:hypothetical protein
VTRKATRRANSQRFCEKGYTPFRKIYGFCRIFGFALEGSPFRSRGRVPINTRPSREGAGWVGAVWGLCNSPVAGSSSNPPPLPGSPWEGRVFLGTLPLERKGDPRAKSQRFCKSQRFRSRGSLFGTLSLPRKGAQAFSVESAPPGLLPENALKRRTHGRSTAAAHGAGVVGTIRLPTLCPAKTRRASAFPEFEPDPETTRLALPAIPALRRMRQSIRRITPQIRGSRS